MNRIIWEADLGPYVTSKKEKFVKLVNSWSRTKSSTFDFVAILDTPTKLAFVKRKFMSIHLCILLCYKNFFNFWWYLFSYWYEKYFVLHERSNIKVSFQHYISIPDQKCGSSYKHTKSLYFHAKKMKSPFFALNKVDRPEDHLDRKSLDIVTVYATRFKRNQKQITVWDIQLSSLIFLFKLITWTLRTQMQGFKVCVLPSSKPFRSIGESGAKIDLQTMEQLMQFSWLLLPRKFFLIYSFSKQVAAKRNSHRPVDKCSRMLIYALLNYTLSSGQKPV